MDELKIAQDIYNNTPLNTEQQRQALDLLIQKTNQAIQAYQKLQQMSLGRMKADQAQSASGTQQGQVA
jgi:hypothetical protein